ncbi:unnamed protein product [Fusarium graminearum]|uniref:Azaphilone pigments biosynthesis cluster protein L N-terminal domain-containing protein n=1 Tax=Gibberella zeae TaxID=5518 RepID=A0A9N8NHX3_GIBZA|nr:unnamed protein product [Fusarium graminearum]
MGDPLGVAGSTVGIVSLGLQLCQGLITYIQAFKGRKEEIEDSIQEVQRVESLLTNLEKLLPEVNLRRCKQSLQNNLVSCYKKLQKLQTFLEALDPPHQSTGASRTVLNTTRSLTYPFQQTKLNSFHQSLRTYLGDLKLAIETVSLYRVLNLFFFLLFAYSFWHFKFKLEVQDQHHRGCELFGMHRNKKLAVMAQFPLKVAWSSARMTSACFQYTSGTSTAGHSVRYKNIVPRNHSPVFRTISEIRKWDIRKIPEIEIVRDMEAIERRIVSMYRDGTASPYDRDEVDWTHAETYDS